MRENVLKRKEAKERKSVREKESEREGKRISKMEEKKG